VSRGGCLFLNFMLQGADVSSNEPFNSCCIKKISYFIGLFYFLLIHSECFASSTVGTFKKNPKISEMQSEESYKAKPIKSLACDSSVSAINLAPIFLMSKRSIEKNSTRKEYRMFFLEHVDSLITLARKERTIASANQLLEYYAIKRALQFTITVQHEKNDIEMVKNIYKFNMNRRLSLNNWEREELKYLKLRLSIYEKLAFSDPRNNSIEYFLSDSRLVMNLFDLETYDCKSSIISMLNVKKGFDYTIGAIYGAKEWTISSENKLKLVLLAKRDVSQYLIMEEQR
jgi:hypothetical protein